MSSFSPTQAELGLVNQIFAIADPKRLGIITGNAAVKVFAGSKLPPTILGEVWAIADKENNGFLTKKGTAIAIRLIAHAQKGEAVKESLLEKVCSLAHIEGMSPVSSGSPSMPLSPPSSPLPGESHLPPLTAGDKAKFLQLFVGCGPANGLLSGEKARDVFIKSKLPVEKLSQIWSLADTHDRGSLDQTDFTIAMYLIQATMSKQITNLPASLPQWLYEQAAGNSHSSIQSHTTGTSSPLVPSLTGSFPASALLTQQNTGPARARLQVTGQERNRMTIVASPTYALSNNSAALGATAFGGLPESIPWDVSPEEKNRYDSFFDNLNPQKRGFIEGDVAVPFMLQSKLSEDVLAQVWDLADLNKDGRLTRDGFAVAMHLIQSRLSGKAIPLTLPISLIPPSMRDQQLPKQTPASSSVSDPMRDLLWDDSPPASATVVKATGPFASSMNSSQPTAILKPQPTGQLSQLKNHATGVGSPLAPAAADPFAVPGTVTSPRFNGGQRDLLGDDDDVAANVVPDNSAEIGNIRNQISSTSRSLENTKAERQSIEASIASQANQLSSLQAQLASAKAAYETEMRLLDTLRERLNKQSSDFQKTQEELIRAESDLSAIRVEKTEIERNVLRDKEEVRDLQRRMKEVEDEIESLKGSIEKAKKESKHQKGLLAIAKKQLATKDAERVKAAKELEQAERDVKEAKEEVNTVDAILHEDPQFVHINPLLPALQEPVPRDTDTPSVAAMYPLPSSPLSPPASFGSSNSLKSNGKSNNPFEHLVMTSSRPSSPFSEQVTDALSESSLTDQQPVEDPDALTPTRKNEKADSHDFVPPTASALEFITDSPVPVPEPTVSQSPLSSASSNPFGLSRDMESTTDEREDTKPGDVLSSVDKAHLEETALENTAFENTASRFPEIRTIGGSMQPDLGIIGDQTDLGQDLLEKESEESDSDCENDGGDIFHDAKESRLSTSSPMEDVGKATESQGKAIDMFAKEETESKALIPNPSTTFDDAFGLNVTSPSTVDQEGQKSVINTFSSGLFSSPAPLAHKDITSSKGTNLNTTSGVSAFDEALGKIPSPNVGTFAHFQLDSGFEDNFNFAAAKAQLDSESSQLQSSHLPSNVNSALIRPNSPFVIVSATPGLTSKAYEEHAAMSFDDIFGKTSTVLPTSVEKSAGDRTALIDSAFGFVPTKSPTQDSVDNISVVPQISQGVAEVQEPGTASVMQSPLRSSIAIPTTSSPSTVQSSSPPLRAHSPKPRVSTGSSNEGSILSKPALPARHSKLSIRLPFRKKKQEQPQPPPPSLPPVSEPDGLFSGADADDVEPVKQLCSMGFERRHVLTALEKHGYDMQRALSSLLGGA